MPREPRSPEEVHEIIMTFSRNHYDHNQNLPYAGKRIIRMLWHFNITKYGRFEYELKVAKWISHPFRAGFPNSCHLAAKRICQENSIPMRIAPHIALIIAAAHMDHIYVYQLIDALPRLDLEDQLKKIIKQRAIKSLLPQPIYEEVSSQL